MSKRLRSGFTTGSCAAAAAKAATILLTTGVMPREVEIPFPGGSRTIFAVEKGSLENGAATASIIKDAGDDPDVTNGAEIIAAVSLSYREIPGPDCVMIEQMQLCRGQGVGRATKPGLAVGVGEPAINPVPRRMIHDAVREAAGDTPISVTISVAGGEILAEKTLNHRLGIVGGLSILGTTGIVRPISADAWTATIKASLDVAREAGLSEIVFSTGRTSEKGAQQLLALPDEAYAMMGDYLAFAMEEAEKHHFATVHFSGMWAKIMKAALKIPQTHVRNGALEVADGARLLTGLGASGELAAQLREANTAREMLTLLGENNRFDLVELVCGKAREYCRELFSGEVRIYLINDKAEVIHHV